MNRLSLSSRRTTKPGRQPYIAMLVLLAVVLLAGRVASLRGCIVPVRTSSGSMVYALLGPHFSIVCRDCGAPFQCGIEYPPESGRAVCPNCGYTYNTLVAKTLSPGRRVWINQLPLWRRHPRAWEMIAFREGRTEKSWSVKRLIAGAGQNVTLSDGDVYLNGRLLRKTMAQLRAMAIPVHNDRYRPSIDPTLSDRWHNDSPDTNWTRNSQGYEHRNPQTDQPCRPRLVDWLEYHPWTCRANPVPPAARTDPSPILDDYGYNQTCSRGALHTVHDILLTVRLQLQGHGRVVVRMADRGHLFYLSLSPEKGQYQLLDNGRSVIQGDRRFRHVPFVLETGICDGRVMVAINRLVLFEYAFELTGFPTHEETVSKQLAIGADGVRVQLGWPRLDRDVYYLGPHNEVRWSAAAPIPEGYWFVLGDNVPISLDSRHGVLVPEDALIGTIIRGP